MFMNNRKNLKAIKNLVAANGSAYIVVEKTPVPNTILSALEAGGYNVVVTPDSVTVSRTRKPVSPYGIFNAL